MLFRSLLSVWFLLQACASDGTSPSNNGGGTTGGGTGGGTTAAQCFDIAGPVVTQPASLWTQSQPTGAAPPDNVGTSVDGSVIIDLTLACSSNPAQLNPCASLLITTVHPDYLPAGKVGVEYAASIMAGGGTPPYRWTRFSGTVPPGMTLDAATGVLRGIPTTAGVYDFFVRVDDSVGGSNVSELNAGVLAARFRLTVGA